MEVGEEVVGIYKLYTSFKDSVASGTNKSRSRRDWRYCDDLYAITKLTNNLISKENTSDASMHAKCNRKWECWVWMLRESSLTITWMDTDVNISRKGIVNKPLSIHKWKPFPCLGIRCSTNLLSSEGTSEGERKVEGNTKEIFVSRSSAYDWYEKKLYVQSKILFYFPTLDFRRWIEVSNRWTRG